MPALNKNLTYLPKDILAIDGKVEVKAGRGRMSRAAVDRIHELVNEGYKVKGYAVTGEPAKSSTKDVSAPVEVKRVKVDNNVIQEFVIFWDESEFMAIDSNGKERSMREVCNKCMVSLVQNHCDSPVILGDISVTIRPRK